MYSGLAFSQGFPNLSQSSGNSNYNQSKTAVSLLTYKYNCLYLPLAGMCCRSDVCTSVIVSSELR